MHLIEVVKNHWCFCLHEIKIIWEIPVRFKRINQNVLNPEFKYIGLSNVAGIIILFLCRKGFVNR